MIGLTLRRDSPFVRCGVLALWAAAICTILANGAFAGGGLRCGPAGARVDGAPGAESVLIADGTCDLRIGAFTCGFAGAYGCPKVFAATAQPKESCRKTSRAGGGAQATCTIAFSENPDFQFASLLAGRAFAASGQCGRACASEITQGLRAPLPLLAYSAASSNRFAQAPFPELPLAGARATARQIDPAQAAAAGDRKSSGSALADAAAAGQTSGITGNLRLVPAWGTIRAPLAAPPSQTGFTQAGALAAIAPLPPPAGFAPGAAPSANSNAYAFGASMNVDYLPAADKLWLEAAYDQGGGSASGGFTTGQNPANEPRSIDSQPLPGDYFAGWNPQINSSCAFAGAGKCEQPRGWDIAGAAKNHWLPIFNSTIFGSSLEIRRQAEEPDSSVSPPGRVSPPGAHIAPQLFSSPLGAFDIGAEYMYARMSQTRPPGLGPGPGATVSGLRAFGPATEFYGGHLRVQSGY